MPKRRGRPAYNDVPLLAQMALLLAKRQVRSIREAARRVADLTEGASTPAVVDRIRGKYAKHQAKLEAWAQAQLHPQAPPRQRRRSPPPASPTRDILEAAGHSPAVAAALDAANNDAVRAAIGQNSAVEAALRHANLGNSLSNSALEAVRRLLNRKP